MVGTEKTSASDSSTTASASLGHRRKCTKEENGPKKGIWGEKRSPEARGDSQGESLGSRRFGSMRTQTQDRIQR